MIDLKTNKHYIVEYKYPTEEYPKYFKMKVTEVTDTTYLISNMDTIMFSRQPTRYSKKDFNMDFTVLEEIDILNTNIPTNLDSIINANRKFDTHGGYYPKFTPFGHTLD